jgi:N,N'-diacetyllegionaminate synthase
MESLNHYFQPENTRCLVVAEVAQTHDGSLGQAHAFIDAAADAGVDAIKFQLHIAQAESSLEEPFRTPFSYEDSTRYKYWQRIEFTETQWAGLVEHARNRGLYFLCSPFSFEAVALLERIGIDGWKVASGEVNNIPLIERLIATRKPILVSSGMSFWKELDHTVTLLQEHDIPYALLQATSMYPTPVECVGLNVLSEFKNRYNCATGLSDHSGSIFPGLAAYTLGARFIEVHMTLSPYMFGPDVSSSLTVEALSQLVKGVHYYEQMLVNLVDKDHMANTLAPLREVFFKSVVASTMLPAHKKLMPEDLALKKPGTGIPAKYLPMLYGKTLKNDKHPDEILTEADILEPLILETAEPAVTPCHT